ncbi:uncharacterized protein LOC143078473 [Mytilus galloprovincialis]|uniref:uncharacterized protein LOC143078473 n=1 Tax=Mytilus galloprovincialis TaxID=29158 RepID=UPI003F7BF1E9
MTTRTVQRKRQKHKPPTDYLGINQDNEFSEDEDSLTISQSASQDRTRDMSKKIFGRAFTFKLSLPTVVLTMGVVYYIIRAQNEFENKCAVLMKYEKYLEELKTLSEKVPILEQNLFKLEGRLVSIDKRVVDIESKIKTANENLTNYERTINLISYTSSILEGDLLKQQQRFTEMENKLNNMETIISNISNNITSIDDQSNDIQEKLTDAEKNQISLKGLLIETVDRAENVHKNVAKIQNMFSEVLIHLPTIEKINKSVTLIMKIDHHLPELQRHLHETEDDLSQLKQDMSNTGEHIKNRLTRLAEDLETLEGNILERTSQLNTDISKTEVEIGIIVEKVDEYSGKIGQFKSNVDSLSADVNRMKFIFQYTDHKVKELDIVV